MNFTFFTLGGRFFWQDICNYQGWIIQRHTYTFKYRLLDPHKIRRCEGSFETCKNSLLKYVNAYELDAPFADTIIILHGYGRTSNSVIDLANFLKEIPANVISINYASLNKGLAYQSEALEQFLQNIDTKGSLSFVTVGASCLLLRKMLMKTPNYRRYNIKRIVNINPLNSGSDLADVLSKIKVCRFLGGPMLRDIATPRALTIAKVPEEIELGLIFCPPSLHDIIKKVLSRFESFPFSTPPSEESYSSHTKTVNKTTIFPLQNSQMFYACKMFLTSGTFSILPKENLPKGMDEITKVKPIETPAKKIRRKKL